MRSTAPVTSSLRKNEMLPLGELLNVICKHTKAELDQYFTEMTLTSDQTLHAAFAEALLLMNGYQNKQVLDSVERAFDGFIGTIHDQTYEHAKELTSDQRLALIKIIKVYKAYTLQQFKIKELIKQLHDLEFDPAFYTKANKWREIAFTLVSNNDLYKFIRSFQDSIAKFEVERFKQDNELVNGYREKLNQVNKDVFDQLDHQLAELNTHFRDELKKTFNTIDFEILTLSGAFVHDLPEYKENASRWVAECKKTIASLNNRKVNATTQDELLLVDNDIREFNKTYLENRQKWVDQENLLNDQYRNLLKRKKQFLEGFANSRRALDDKIKVMMDNLAQDHRYPALPLRISNLGFQVDTLACFREMAEAANKLVRKRKEVEGVVEDFTALIGEISDYLKGNVNSRVSLPAAPAVTSSFVDKWQKIYQCYQDILNAKIVIDNLELDKKQIDDIKQRVNFTDEMVEKFRNNDHVDIASEMKRLQLDAQYRFVSLQPQLTQLARCLAKPEIEFSELVEKFFGQVWNQLQIEYDTASASRVKKIDEISVALTSLKREIDHFDPVFFNSPPEPARVLNKKELLTLDTCIQQLAQPKQLSTPILQANLVSSFSKPEPIVSKPRGFLRRHWLTLTGATLVGGLAGAGVGFTLGWFFAPVTLGLSVPVMAGLGALAGVAAGGMLGFGGSLAACSVWDRCSGNGKITQRVMVPDQPASLPNYTQPYVSKNNNNNMIAGQPRSGSSPRLFQGSDKKIRQDRVLSQSQHAKAFNMTLSQ